MKEKRILEALSEVKDVYIEEVGVGNEEYKTNEGKELAVSINTQIRKNTIKKNWIKWLGAAAVIALIISFGSGYFEQEVVCKDYFSASVTNGRISLEKEEPLLTKNPFLSGMPSMEFPVYKNLSYVKGTGGTPHYFTLDEFTVMAEEIAEKLETEILDVTYSSVVYDGIETRSDVCEVMLKSDIAEIRIMGNGEISIFFNEEVALPEGYRFSDENTYVEAMQLVRYLTETYHDLLGFENAADDCRIAYDLTGKRSIQYSAYDAAMEEPEAIIEYCFQNATFYGNENGLTTIHYGDVREAAEYLGDYEIITEEEARQRLEDGNYISVMLTEEEALGGAFSDENIKLVELTYLMGSVCQYYQPYYCFYVELEGTIEGISNYGTFYVPALCDEDLLQFSDENPLGN